MFEMPDFTYLSHRVVKVYEKYENKSQDKKLVLNGSLHEN